MDAQGEFSCFLVKEILEFMFYFGMVATYVYIYIYIYFYYIDMLHAYVQKDCTPKNGASKAETYSTFVVQKKAAKLSCCQAEPCLNTEKHHKV